MKKTFHKCAATKLIGMISRVKERGKQPYWIIDDDYTDLVKYWGTENQRKKAKKLPRVGCLIEMVWGLINIEQVHVRMLKLLIFW